MSLIEKVAYLEVCSKCGKHACIVFSDGSKSPTFGSKETGFDLVQAFFGQGDLTLEEVKVLDVEIVKSSLMEKETDYDDAVVLISLITEAIEKSDASLRR